MSVDDVVPGEEPTDPVPGLIRAADAVSVRAKRGRLDAEDVLDALLAVQELRAALDQWEPTLISTARERGISWADIAPALGVTSRQAAERRYLRIRPANAADSQDSTGEERIQAERDRRAADRAAAGWARDHAAELRQLAGQIAGLEDLSSPAREHADLVLRALGGNDAATLLSPLSDTEKHLRDTHPRLADQIDDITQRTDALRRQTQLRREGTSGRSPSAG